MIILSSYLQKNLVHHLIRHLNTVDCILKVARNVDYKETALRKKVHIAIWNLSEKQELVDDLI